MENQEDIIENAILLSNKIAEILEPIDYYVYYSITRLSPYNLYGKLDDLILNAKFCSTKNQKIIRKKHFFGHDKKTVYPFIQDRHPTLKTSHDENIIAYELSLVDSEPIKNNLYEFKIKIETNLDTNLSGSILCFNFLSYKMGINNWFYEKGQYKILPTVICDMFEYGILIHPYTEHIDFYVESINDNNGICKIYTDHNTGSYCLLNHDIFPRYEVIASVNNWNINPKHADKCIQYMATQKNRISMKTVCVQDKLQNNNATIVIPEVPIVIFVWIVNCDGNVDNNVQNNKSHKILSIKININYIEKKYNFNYCGDDIEFVHYQGYSGCIIPIIGTIGDVINFLNIYDTSIRNDMCDRFMEKAAIKGLHNTDELTVTVETTMSGQNSYAIVDACYFCRT